MNIPDWPDVLFRPPETAMRSGLMSAIVGHTMIRCRHHALAILEDSPLHREMIIAQLAMAAERLKAT